MRNIGFIIIQIIPVILSILLISCDISREHVPSKEIRVPPICKSNESDLMNYSNCFSKVKFIPLELSEASVLGYINKVIYLNSMIYLFNFQSQVIKIFDVEGNYIKTFNKMGSGPDEYIGMRDFDIDKDGNIYVLTFKNIYIYDSSFVLLNKIKFDDNGGSQNIKYIYPNCVIINFNHVFNLNNKRNNRIAKINLTTGNCQYYGKTILKSPWNNSIKMNPKNNCVIEPAFHDYRIFTLSDQDISVGYSLVFDDSDKIQDEELNDALNGGKFLFSKNRSFFVGRVTNISNFFDTEGLIFFNFIKDNRFYNAVYSKSDSITTFSKSRHRIARNGPRVTFQAYSDNENCLIGLIYPHRIKTLKESYLLSPEQIDFLNSVHSNSNPIVVKYFLNE